MKRLRVCAAVALGLWAVGCGRSGGAGGSATGEPAGGEAAGGEAAGGEAAGASGDAWCGPTPCPCKQGTEMKAGGKTSVCMLDRPMTVQGLPAAAKQVGFDKAGALRQLTLSAAHKIGDVTCKAGSTVEVWGPARLKSCSTEDVVTLDGLSCTNHISLTASGKLRRCQLTKAAKVGDLDIPARGWITLYESGKPGRFEAFERPVEVQGHRCLGGFNYLYESGTLKRCKLADEETLEGKKMRRGADVCFSESGAVVSCKELRFDKP